MSKVTSIKDSILILGQNKLPANESIKHYRIIARSLKTKSTSSYEQLGETLQGVSLPQYANINKNLKSIPGFKFKAFRDSLISSFNMFLSLPGYELAGNQKAWQRTFPVATHFVNTLFNPARKTIEDMRLVALRKMDSM